MPRPFTDVLRDLAGGETFEQCTDRLAQVVEAVDVTGSPGEFSIKLKIKKNGDNGFEVTDEIKTKLPEPTRGRSFFFRGQDYSLVREDARQTKMNFDTIDGGKDG